MEECEGTTGGGTAEALGQVPVVWREGHLLQLCKACSFGRVGDGAIWGLMNCHMSRNCVTVRAAQGEGHVRRCLLGFGVAKLVSTGQPTGQACASRLRWQ